MGNVKNKNLNNDDGDISSNIVKHFVRLEVRNIEF